MILVAGMHRSGSSILAKLLLEAGADFGNPETFYPADQWNPDGYFEHLDILDVNLKLVNGPFGKLSYAFLPGEKTIRQRAKSISPKVKAAIRTHGKNTVKENRFCLTLPAWIDHGLEVEKALVCIRHPANVVRSLWKRNKLPAWFGYRIWLLHNERLLNTLHQQGIPYKVVSHETLTNAETGVEHLSAVLAFLNLNKTAAEVGELLHQNVRMKPKRKHAKTLPLSVDQLYQDLLNQSIG